MFLVLWRYQAVTEADWGRSDRVGRLGRVTQRSTVGIRYLLGKRPMARIDAGNMTEDMPGR